jgi:hypothetical protein
VEEVEEEEEEGRIVRLAEKKTATNIPPDRETGLDRVSVRYGTRHDHTAVRRSTWSTGIL